MGGEAKKFFKLLTFSIWAAAAGTDEECRGKVRFSLTRGTRFDRHQKGETFGGVCRRWSRVEDRTSLVIARFDRNPRTKSLLRYDS